MGTDTARRIDLIEEIEIDLEENHKDALVEFQTALKEVEEAQPKLARLFGVGGLLYLCLVGIPCWYLANKEVKRVVDKLNEISKAKPELEKPFFIILWYLEYGGPPPVHVLKLVEAGEKPTVGGSIKPWQLALVGTYIVKAPADPAAAAKAAADEVKAADDAPAEAEAAE